MIINEDKNGAPIGFIETLISNERVITITLDTVATASASHTAQQ
jgi:hypothetical protein